MDYLALFGPIAPYAFFTAIACVFAMAGTLLRKAIKYEQRLTARQQAVATPR
jgi:hypothetical protein